MKKIVRNISLISVALLLASTLKAQAPQGINYQGVLRDATGNLMISQSVNLDISVDENNCNCAVYEETQTTTTDAYGLFSIVVGSGTPVTGTFAAIDWSNGVYSFGVKVNGGTVGSTSVQSVPYALFADSANGVKNSLWKNNAGLTYSMDKVAIGTSNSTVTFNSHTGRVQGGFVSAGIANYIGVDTLSGWSDALQIRVKTGNSSGRYLDCGKQGTFGLDTKFSVDLDGNIATKGKVAVDSIATATPVKNTLYGNSLPLAYGNVYLGGPLAENYGFASATRPSTGVYEMVLNNPAPTNYFPIIMVTPYSATALMTTQQYNPTTKKITVRVFNASGTLTNAEFSIVVFGTAQ